MSEAATNSERRLIKKYPNRRLYDAKTSSYITSADVKRMVMDQQDIQVLDAKTGDDVTRQILLQIILDEEHSCAVPILSSDVLSQLIRCYGNAMQTMMGSYLERNMRAFKDIQSAMQAQSQRMYGENVRVPQELFVQFMNLQASAIQNVMAAYMDQTQRMFAQLHSPAVLPPRKDENPPESG